MNIENLRVHSIKMLGPGLSSMSPERRQARKDCIGTKDVGEQIWEEMLVKSVQDKHRPDRQSDTAGKCEMWKQ